MPGSNSHWPNKNKKACQYQHWLIIIAPALPRSVSQKTNSDKTPDRAPQSAALTLLAVLMFQESPTDNSQYLNEEYAVDNALQKAGSRPALWSTR